MCAAALGSSARGSSSFVSQAVVVVVVMNAMGRVRLCEWPEVERVALALPINLNAKRLLSRREGQRWREAVKCVEAAVSLIKRRGRAANRLTQDTGAVAFRPWLGAMVGNRNQVSQADDDDDDAADLPEAGKPGFERRAKQC